MSSRYDVVTAGEILALLLAGEQRPLREADWFTRSVAGAESNVSIGLARLGHTVAYIGRIGTDAPGHWAANTLRAEGVNTTWLRHDPDRPTGLIMRDCPAGRPVSVAYDRAGSAASALTADDADRDLITGSRVLFLTGITALLSPSSARFTERAVEYAEAGGAHIIFDLNVRLRLASPQAWRAVLHRYAGRADTLLIGEDELRSIAEPGEAHQFLTGRTATVILKRGAHGAEVHSHTGQLAAPPRPVPVIDPVGAGDAFAAGWISAMLRARSPDECLREAILVASLAVATPTDIAGLPTAAERDRLLAAEGADVDR
jgi:2-dehydro-3-deoxygluconokinase